MFICKMLWHFECEMRMLGMVFRLFGVQMNYLRKRNVSAKVFSQRNSINFAPKDAIAFPDDEWCKIQCRQLANVGWCFEMIRLWWFFPKVKLEIWFFDGCRRAWVAFQQRRPLCCRSERFSHRFRRIAWDSFNILRPSSETGFPNHTAKNHINSSQNRILKFSLARSTDKNGFAAK